MPATGVSSQNHRRVGEFLYAGGPYSCALGRLSAASDQMQTKHTREICNIDLLRCIAAITILFWHYQHLYFPTAGVNPVGNDPSIQPLFSVFSWLYLYGSWAVQFFWILSGFVFFHAYAGRQQVSARDYFVNRFSRLYPLHAITLIVVAFLQFVSMRYFGKYQIYPQNDAYHFLLNVFMASHWGFQAGYSFNAPIWSISVEVLVYGLFFVYLKGLGVGLVSSLVWLAWSLLLLKNAPSPIAECAALFALGGSINRLGLAVTQRWGARAGTLPAAAILLVSAVLLARGTVPFEPAVKYLLFPALIWFAFAVDMAGLSVGKVGVALGNLTYSSYLIHVPIQICLIMLLDAFFGGRAVVNSPAFLLAYLGGVLIAAHFTFRLIELPLKRRLRNRLGRQAKATLQTM